MAQLKLFFLGPPCIERDDSPVEIKRSKGLALFVYLAITGGMHRRDALATLFWPESSQRNARGTLRRELWLLKQTLGAEWLIISDEEVGLRCGAGLWLDVVQFQEWLTESQASVHITYPVSPTALTLLTQAVKLYRDDFLTDFTLPDSPAFDEWQFFQTERLRQALATALERLVEACSTQHQWERAIVYARRWLTLDPLQESIHRYLMQLYALAGQRTAALRQYETYKRLLQAELGVSPDAESQALIENIRAKRFPSLPQFGDAERQGYLAEILSPISPLPSAVSVQPFLDNDTAPASERNIFVGRERELAALAEVLAMVQTGKGQIVFVTGGAGQGKTMLVQEFVRRAQAANPDLLMVSGVCNAHTGIGDPYLPFREALIMLAGDIECHWASSLLTPQHTQRLWSAMPVTVAALLNYAPDLLGTFVPIRALYARAAAFASLDPPWFQALTKLMTHEQSNLLEEKRLFTQYTAVLKAIAVQRPVVLILEDLHWIDAASNDLLFHLSRAVSNSRILLLGTYRPDELVWGRGKEYQSLANIISELKRQYGDIWLDLDSLSIREGRQFVDDYLDMQPNHLDEAFRTTLFQRTQGHALFTVELLCAMQERGDLQQDAQGYWIKGAVVDWDMLPVKVEGVIEQRVGRLSPDLQSALTVASIEGELFTAEVVARIQQIEERELVQRLSSELDRQHRLVTAQSLTWLGSQRLSHYRFRHHLFQHYLYQRLDTIERTHLHEAVGKVLEILYGEQTEQIAVQLAQHFTRAGLNQKAITYHLQAGERAYRLSANQEAITHLTQGLTLLAEVPSSALHAQQELALQVTLGNALMARKGYAAAEVGEIFLRAYHLCQQLGETEQFFRVLHGLNAYHNLRAEWQTACAVAEQMLQLAQNQSDPIFRVSAHYLLGNTLFFLGEFSAAREHFEQGYLLYNPQHHPAYLQLYGQDEGVVCLANLAWTLWFLGYPDQALELGHKALKQAQMLNHPLSLAIANSYVANIYLSRQEEHVAQQHAQEVIRLATEHQFALILALGMLYQGLSLVRQGKSEGIVHIERGLDAWQATGSELVKSYFLIGLAEGYRNAGQVEKGLDLLSEALIMVDKNGNRFLEAELFRLKGELLLMQGNEYQSVASNSLAAEAEACFRTAISIANRQQAKTLELRATISLCRLWQTQSKRSQASQSLPGIYNWFKEGFGTIDLIQAKVLLENLS